MSSAAPFAARILISAIFVQGALGKILGWSGQMAYMQSHGMHFAVAPLLAIALLIEAVGTLCLVLGYRARVAAAIMFVYLIGVSVVLHAFWSAPAASAGNLQTHFLKNMGVAGGLLMIAVYGPGRWALDRSFSRAK
jgi:putative oxidoreductase